MAEPEAQTQTQPQNSEYELLTEHFGYPPVALLDDIINTVNVLADRALDSVERLLVSIPPQTLGFSAKHSSRSAQPQLPPEEAAKLEIENGTHQLETLLNASIDKNFDLFELYTMRNILTVRPQDQPYMKLAHYEGLDFAALEGQQAHDRPTTESVTALRRRLHASQRLNTALEAEHARNDALLTRLRSALGVIPGNVKSEEGQTPVMADSPFGFLYNKASLQGAGTDKPITTTAEFTLSQLQALRALSTSLRTLIPELKPSEPNTDDPKEEDNKPRNWRRERVGYVESASRKYLENARGLELGAQGDVRDGEWQGEGRKVTRSDVENLEQVMAMLNQDKKPKQGDEGDGEAMDES